MGSHESQPRFIEPMLLSPGPVPESEDWSLEIKWDGMRAQVRYDGTELCLRSRTGRDWTSSFPELSGLTDQLAGGAVTLDGELVCLRDDGRPDFAALRARLSGTRQPCPATLQIFDVLHLDGHSTRAWSYRERRSLLDELGLKGACWRTPASVTGDGARFVSEVGRLGLEGVVAKRLDAPYRPGVRSTGWIKHKLRRRERLLVSGVRRTPEGRVEALHVARPTDAKPVPAGTVELGLRQPAIAAIETALTHLPGRQRGAVTWYPPSVSVEISCHGLQDGPVRDAVLVAAR